MKKDIEWLKKEFDDLFNGKSILTVGRSVVDEILDQLDEPETKQLEQIINVLENELKILDSHIRGLEKDWDEEVHSLENELKKSDNRILDLEHELYIEKTKDSKHKFYWFTAKKKPFITDVSYMSKENHFYGFKQPPNYYYIELDDLRFVTNCSLDDLIEQFR